MNESEFLDSPAIRVFNDIYVIKDDNTDSNIWKVQVSCVERKKPSNFIHKVKGLCVSIPKRVPITELCRG